MGEKLSTSAARVQQALTEGHFTFRVLELPASTRTSREAAAAVGCDVECIAKSIIFKSKTTGAPILVIASGINRVDEKKVSSLLGEPIGKADADFVRAQTGYVIGGVPPLGHVQPIKTFIDQDLMSHDKIWAAAGTPHALFEMKPADLPVMTGGEVVEIKQ